MSDTLYRVSGKTGAQYNVDDLCESGDLVPVEPDIDQDDRPQGPRCERCGYELLECQKCGHYQTGRAYED